ncbi:hypothetical protein WLW93_00660 [Bordetella bronchiseptica]
MRILFLLIVAANLWVYALGQGWLGLRPADEGRDAARLSQEMKADQVKVLRP